MKKSIYLFSMLLFLLATATSCSDWGEEPELNFLELESADVSFDAFGGTRDIIVKSTDDVTASCGDSWCTTAVSGNKVTVTVSANGELLSRATVVTVISGVKKVQMPVTQSGVRIDFDRSPLILSGEAGDTTLLINAPVPVTVTSSTAWLVPSVTDTTLTLHVEDNPAFASRASTLTLTAGSFSVAVEVTQRGRKAWLPFDAYVGTWTFTHTISTLTSATMYYKQATAVASGGTALHVTLKAGMSTSSTFTFIMEYDSVTGTVNIPVQKVFEAGNNDVRLSGFDGGSVYFDIGNGGMTGAPVSGTLAKPVLAFTDNGKATGTNAPYVGFILWQVARDTGRGVGEYTTFGYFSTSRYTNITMTKQ
ncbi:MAG: hypothetical protein LBF69_02615 [Prevotellaceae bacterium]|jgi:hypothetical protein|nr:hypothetical protein [Prevotellaceae bacterium]